MPDRPTISVIVPTLNRRQDLLEFTETLVKQTVLATELLVVDAGEVADMEAALRAALKGSGIRLRYVKSAAGTSLQRNIALDMVQGELVFMFDDDILLEPDYIERSIEAFELPFEPPVGCVLGTFISPARPRGWQQGWFRLFGMTHSVAGDEAGMSRAGGVQWLVEPSHPVKVPVASGGRTAYRREAIGKERFDEFLPGYTLNEDVEFSYRIGQRWTIVHSPHARLFHKRSPNARVDYGDRVSRLIYSNFYFFKKHIPKRPREIAAFAWANVGISTFYTGVGVARAPTGEKSRVLRGIARGYRRCVDDLRGRKVE